VADHKKYRIKKFSVSAWRYRCCRLFGHSALSVRVPWCQKLQMTA